jgi:metallo-beta-lactamase family protein
MGTKIHFLGAADTVTGSRTIVEHQNTRWLVDCGLFQGSKEFRQRNWQEFPVNPASIDAVILTHAHLDHVGYLPRLCATGFKGKIFCSKGTADLARIILLDAAYLEEEFAKYANESGYSNHKPAVPLFNKEDAEQAISQFEPVDRYQWIKLGEHVSFQLLRAGHIIGASYVQLHLISEQKSCTVTFTGDIGNNRSMVLKGPEPLISTDVLILESTYGDRLQPRTDPLQDLAAVANRTFKRGGVLVIPAFAVGRAQEVTYMFRQLENRNLIPKVPVILDSPMATSAMSVCLNHPEDQILESGFIGAGENFKPAFFEVTETPDDSMVACMRDGPMVVISASGMLNGGRILHHLKHRLPDEKNTIMFTGYQADGTKGRFLQENSGKLEALRIHHKEVPVAAEIVTLDVLSSHADYQDTMAWLNAIQSKPKIIALNHGHPNSQRALADRIIKALGIKTLIANEKSIIDITECFGSKK